MAGGFNMSRRFQLGPASGIWRGCRLVGWRYCITGQMRCRSCAAPTSIAMRRALVGAARMPCIASIDPATSPPPEKPPDGPPTAFSRGTRYVGIPPEAFSGPSGDPRTPSSGRPTSFLPRPDEDPIPPLAFPPRAVRARLHSLSVGNHAPKLAFVARAVRRGSYACRSRFPVVPFAFEAPAFPIDDQLPSVAFAVPKLGFKPNAFPCDPFPLPCRFPSRNSPS